jgi:phosphopentomutase
MVIVLDGVGIGEAPDAALYGDSGSNSLANTARRLGGLHLPNLAALGLGSIEPIAGVPPPKAPSAAFGKLCPRSPGKDSITGHWELMGVHLARPLPTYPRGFPAAVIEAFTRATGHAVIGNRPASGTEIISELGAQHLECGALIVYTSADSVFQVAAHEDRVPPDELHAICRVARGLLTGEHGVGRVIARPFTGTPGAFVRTAARRDFPLLPPSDTLLDILKESGRAVISVGKIDDLFGGRGMTQIHHVTTNAESIEGLLKFMNRHFEGLLFVNLVEFDTVFGHRNDPEGYARALAAFDACLPAVHHRMRPGDLAMIVADHGVDPTTPSTDHSREYVPLLAFGPPSAAGLDLGARGTLSDVAATVAEMFALRPPKHGTSFLGDIAGT